MSALVLAALLAAAPTPIDLAQARSRSRENTQALTALLQASTAEQDVRISRSALLPQLNLSAGGSVEINGPQRYYTLVPVPGGTSTRQTLDVAASINPAFSVGLGLTQLIYDRSVWARLQQSGALLESQRGQALEQRDASELEGVLRFFSLFRTQATIQVLEANVRRSEQQLERARALFQAGKLAKSEELAARVNLGNDRITVTGQQAQLATDQIFLATWLALPGAEPVAAVDPGVLQAPPVPPVPLEQALEEARTHRPLLMALRQQLRASQLQEVIAHAGYLPRVSFQAQYGRAGPNADVVFAQPRLQNSLSMGIGLSWNLFAGLSTDAQERRAGYQREVSELSLRQSERDLEGAVRQAHSGVLAQIAITELAETNRQAAAEALANAEGRFSAGLISTLEVRDAQLKLTQAELTLLQNRIEVERARFALMRAMGTLSPGEAK